MAVREVLRYPHPALKRRARELTAGEDDARAARVAADLVDTMRSFGHCVGIAAPQVDEGVRLIAVDVTGHPKATTAAGLLVLANPIVAAASGAEVGREGCLSIPALTANVRRATAITVEGRDALGGEQVRIDAEGFEARCLLHEIDHLDGVLFLDRVDSLTDDVFRRKRRS